MCLSCQKEFGAHGRAQIEKTLFWGKDKTFIDKVTIHTHDNKIVSVSEEQAKEIAENALVVIATGVDFNIDIWAIQWPNEYKVKHL